MIDTKGISDQLKEQLDSIYTYDRQCRKKCPLIDQVITENLDEKIFREYFDALRNEQEIEAFADNFFKQYDAMRRTFDLESIEIKTEHELDTTLEVLRNTKVFSHAAFPMVLIFEVTMIDKIRATIAANCTIMGVEGIYDATGKIAELCNTHWDQFQSNIIGKLRDLAHKYLHGPIVKRIKSNDPELVEATLGYSAVHTNPLKQLEIFSALANNCYLKELVLRPMGNTPVKIPNDMDNVIVYALKNNKTLRQVHNFKMVDAKGTCWSFSKFHDYLNKNCLDQAFNALKCEYDNHHSNVAIPVETPPWSLKTMEFKYVTFRAQRLAEIGQFLPGTHSINQLRITLDGIGNFEFNDKTDSGKHLYKFVNFLEGNYSITQLNLNWVFRGKKAEDNFSSDNEGAAFIARISPILERNKKYLAISFTMRQLHLTLQNQGLDYLTIESCLFPYLFAGNAVTKDIDNKTLQDDFSHHSMDDFSNVLNFYYMRYKLNKPLKKEVTKSEAAKNEFIEAPKSSLPKMSS